MREIDTNTKISKMPEIDTSAQVYLGGNAYCIIGKVPFANSTEEARKRLLAEQQNFYTERIPNRKEHYDIDPDFNPFGT